MLQIDVLCCSLQPSGGVITRPPLVSHCTVPRASRRMAVTIWHNLLIFVPPTFTLFFRGCSIHRRLDPRHTRGDRHAASCTQQAAPQQEPPAWWLR